MRLHRRLAAVFIHVFLRAAAPRPPNEEDVARAEFSTHPGGKALRFSERLRRAFRRRWLRLRRP